MSATDDTDQELDEDGPDAAGDSDASEASDDAPATPPNRARSTGDEDVESIDQIVKKEARAGGDEEDDASLTLGREEKLEPLAVKVVPPQETEFVCKKCYLVKHRSQLKDAKRKLCRDCA
ncbi:MAG: DUF4193 family protein [Actinomycetota bacterium]